MHMKESGSIIWLTGIPSSGKTTIAKALLELLDGELLDGDLIRDTPISEDLGFSWEDREKHIRRVGWIAHLLAKQTNVVCSFISPSRKVREELKSDNFLEVYLHCPLEVAMERDAKGLYGKAERGEIKGLTGYDAPYQKPLHPDLILDTSRLSVDECVERILERL